ncbi:MAG TPA: methionine--tRNA ligase, partial [Candidatus Ruania gallistercoris]|nr:methionine--tRNA ligase [Candidatus Ruania gallistercoris]
LKSDPGRLATVLHTTAQAVSDCNTLLSPFLPHSAQQVHEVLGGTGEFAPQPRIEEVTDLDDDSRQYPVITGDYRAFPAWESRPVTAGTPIAKPTPVFTKLDESVVEEELDRLRVKA